MPNARKKVRREAADATDYFSAAAIGALKGTVLRGVTAEEGQLTAGGLTATALASVAGARLRVAVGHVKPRTARVARCRETYADDAAWARALASQIGTTPPKAELLLAQSLQALDDEHCLMGSFSERPVDRVDHSTASYVIEACAASWTHHGLHAAQASASVLTANELAHLFADAQLDNPEHPGFLTLRPHLWTHAAPTADVTGSDVPIDVPLHRHFGFGEHLERRKYEIPHGPAAPFRSTVIEAFAPQAEPLDADECWDLAILTLRKLVLDGHPLEKLKADYPSILEEDDYDLPTDLYGLRDLLTRPGMHQAAYKSIIQKLHRFQPEWVRLPDADDEVVETAVVLVCTAAMCCAPEAGCFNPEFARYVKGSTAMLKRAAVSIVEDGGDLTAVPGLMALAAATSEVEGYHLDWSALGAVLYRLGARHEHGVFEWRNKTPDGFGQRARHGEDFYRAALEAGDIVRCERDWEVFEGDGASWQHSAALLDMLGAFPGDKTMTHVCADMVSVFLGTDDEVQLSSNHSIELLRRARPAPKWTDAERTQPCAERTIDFAHCFCDQHVTRGIGYAALTMDRDADGFFGRHRQTWECVAGYNYRTSAGAFDPNDPAVAQVRAAQRLLACDLLRKRPGHRAPFQGNGVFQVESLDVDIGTLAAGVGVLGPFRIKTTIAENRADGMVYPEDVRAMTTWNVIACLGSESDTIVVMHEPTRRLNGNAKKPRITPTVQARVDAAVRQQCRLPAGVPFRSRVLPEYDRAAWNELDLKWRLHPTEAARAAGFDVLTWDYDRPSFETTVRMPLVEAPAWPDTVLETLSDDSLAREALVFEGQAGIVENAQFAVERLVEHLAPAQRLRLLGFVKQQYAHVKLPTPSLQGTIGSDQLEAPQRGDWTLYRVLLLISRIVPAALAPMHIPHFRVPDARALRLVEGWIGAVASAGEAPFADAQPLWQRQVQRITAALEDSGHALMDYQAETIRTMLRRDRTAVVPVNAHFVALDVGMGKTLLGITYLCRYLAARGTGTKVLWFTDPSVVPSCVDEFKHKWKLSGVRLLKTAQDLFDEWSIGVVSYSLLSTTSVSGVAFADGLVRIAAQSACCFDETHLLYATGVVRNSTALRIAKASPRFVMLTATPVGSSRQKLAETWLSLSSPFEVNDRNVMVASARMLSARIALPFRCVEHVVDVELDPNEVAASLAHARKGDWGNAARVAREGTHDALVAMAIEKAQSDRVRNRPDGGCFLVVDNDAEADELVRRINDLDGAVGPADAPLRAVRYSLEAATDPGAAIVVQTIHRCVGYNLDRLGCMVTGVYGSNPAKRYQIRGRLKRLTQTRAEVHFYTLVPRNTVLELLHKRQSTCDAKAESLEAIAQEFALQWAPGA